MPEAMISPKIREALLTNIKYEWTIKLEAEGVPNCFLIDKPFEGTFEEARTEGNRLVDGAVVKIGKILLMRGAECKNTTQE